jgi:hypothetical protein
MTMTQEESSRRFVAVALGMAGRRVRAGALRCKTSPSLLAIRYRALIPILSVSLADEALMPD